MEGNTRACHSVEERNNTRKIYTSFNIRLPCSATAAAAIYFI